MTYWGCNDNKLLFKIVDNISKQYFWNMLMTFGDGVVSMFFLFVGIRQFFPFFRFNSARLIPQLDCKQNEKKTLQKNNNFKIHVYTIKSTNQQVQFNIHKY